VPTSKYTPKHRTPAAPRAPKKALRNTLVLSSIAVGATGLAVAGGVSSAPTSADGVVSAAADLRTAEPLTAEQLARRAESQPSRSDRRTDADPAKAATLAAAETAGSTYSRTEDIRDEDPREIGRALLPEFGFGDDQFECLDSLYESESGWRWNADNPTSSAYGIPQALPGSKMSSAGADWESNPVTQIRWGLGYIADRYGTPCSAWGFKQGNNWY
jgi:hypothetical protein